MLCDSSPKVKGWHGYFAVLPQGDKRSSQGRKNDAAYCPNGTSEVPKDEKTIQRIDPRGQAKLPKG